ncbi:hypothetical protein D1AOALGA4SA_6376 [Olavius algarvensis Delta 1 endosymbiont]|nr:hypothetical protein D1AOALGA4SA_6376 [Olavius algarvensis Delta 1 endosymbiont]
MLDRVSVVTKEINALVSMTPIKTQRTFTKLLQCHLYFHLIRSYKVVIFVQKFLNKN